MHTDAHKAALQESMEVLVDTVQKGIERRQRTIGFHCSAAATHLVEMYLHSAHLIDPGTTIKHNMFASEKKARERLPDFPSKDELLPLLVALENRRNILCYGKPQTKKYIEKALDLFYEIRRLLDRLGVRYE